MTLREREFNGQVSLVVGRSVGALCILCTFSHPFRVHTGDQTVLAGEQSYCYDRDVFLTSLSVRQINMFLPRQVRGTVRAVCVFSHS